MQLQRGMRDKLDKYLNLHDTFEAEMTVDGSGEYDFCCFGVDTADKLSDDRYMIFYNQTASPQRKIQFQMSGTSSKFLVNLSKLPQQIQKLIFTVSINGNSVMDDIRSFVFSVKQGGSELLRLQVSGTDFKAEKAIISVEVYRKDTWRINAVARGFNGGLGDLLRTYGEEEAAPIQSPVSPSQPAKVNLQKGQKVSLIKGSQGLGEILINLNWKQPTDRFSKPIDLDLGCLYELKDGSKGTVQALGKRFGSLTGPPYIALDGDDRFGASANGENLRINGQMVSKIKRILVYTFIYEGIANWKGADGVVIVQCSGGSDIIVHMDEYGSRQIMCAIAMLENVNDTLSIEKIVQFFQGHRAMDQAFHWGLRWVNGSK